MPRHHRLIGRIHDPDRLDTHLGRVVYGEDRGIEERGCGRARVADTCVEARGAIVAVVRLRNVAGSFHLARWQVLTPLHVEPVRGRGWPSCFGPGFLDPGPLLVWLSSLSLQFNLVRLCSC